MKKDTSPSTAYGIEYLKLPWGASSRWENDPLFQWLANCHFKIMKELGWSSFLDAGCGRGWVVWNLRKLGYAADGIEYGAGSILHSVCGSTFADLTEPLSLSTDLYDYVSCVGVLSHLPESHLVHAMSELGRVARHGVSFNINVSSKTDSGLPYFPEIAAAQLALGAHNKRSYLTRKRWWEIIREAGLREHPRSAELVSWGNPHEQFSGLLCHA